MATKKKQSTRYAFPTIGPVYLDENFTLNHEIIRQLCIVHHWTYEDLASYFGVTKGAAHRWATGVRRPYRHNEGELVRLVEKTNRLLEENYGSIPPEHRWLSPRLVELRKLGKEIEGAEAPESQARLINLGRAHKREMRKVESNE